jgi:hypothetical protein
MYRLPGTHTGPFVVDVQDVKERLG